MAECSAWLTRSSSSPRATSKSPPRSGPACSSAADSSTRRRKPTAQGERPFDGRNGHFHGARRCDLESADVRERLRERVLAPDPAVHRRELAAAAVLALAEPDPALPLRRIGALPAALPTAPAVDGPARPVADERAHRSR